MANNFLPFCPTDTGTNLLSQADYSVAPDRSNGNQPGVASSKLVNKAMRQSSFVASQLAQLTSNITGLDTLDDGDTAKFLAQLRAALIPINPIVAYYTNSTTYQRSYAFILNSANATAGATYTNNGVTYTVSATIAAGAVLIAKGNGLPTASGTLTKASGTGDATITFYAYRMPKWVDVRVTGGGAAGGGAFGTAAGETSCGGGGGAGETAFKRIFIGSLGLTETITVGAGGTGVAGAAGNNGSASSFGAQVTAQGGGGGSSVSNSSGVRIASGGGGGTGGTGANLAIKGGQGAYGTSTSLANAQGVSGYGGGSFWSPGGIGFVGVVGSSANVGAAGQSYGSGGGGAFCGQSVSNIAGGAGIGGVCVVEEVF